MKLYHVFICKFQVNGLRRFFVSRTGKKVRLIFLLFFSIQNQKKAVYYLQDFCPAYKGDKNAPLYESAGFFGRGA